MAIFLGVETARNADVLCRHQHCSSWAWKIGLQTQVCNTFGIAVTVAHYPTGASKWNPIEHRLFSEISKNWAAEPLDSYETMLKSIRTTDTQTGLAVTAYLDRNEHPTRLKPDPQLIPSLRLSPGQSTSSMEPYNSTESVKLFFAPPYRALLTEAKRSDVKLADSFTLNPGSIVTVDRGYTDYALFRRWMLAGVFFVTRMKEHAVFTVESEFEVPENRNILADQIIQLTGVQAQLDCPGPLRRVVVWDAHNQREIVLLTNLFEFGSTTVCPASTISSH